MSTRCCYYLLIAAIVPFAFPLQAADTGITAQQADTIISQLNQIRALLARQADAAVSPPVHVQPDKPKVPVKLPLAGIMLGSANAPVTIVEFTDYQCPFCNRFYTQVFGKLKETFIDTGKVRFYSRDLPLDIHPNALQAAHASRCADDQGHFWPMRDKMSANPTKLDIDTLVEYARGMNMDTVSFRNCIESAKYQAAIEKDIQAAKDIGASGTPAFVVGKSTADGVDGELVLGALPYQTFQQKLTDLIKP